MGYVGRGKLIAFEFKTIDDTCCVVGGFTTGGSGGFSGTTTITGAPGQVKQLPETFVDVGSGSTLRPVRRTMPVTGGISALLTPTSCGTARGSFVGATSAVLSGVV